VIFDKLQKSSHDYNCFQQLLKLFVINVYHKDSGTFVLCYATVCGEVLAWLSVWSKVHMISIWSSWCHCHPIICCSSKIQNGLRFWCRLTQDVLEKIRL